jgi:hypothetical protein
MKRYMFGNALGFLPAGWGKIRNPNVEIRMKSETRSPKSVGEKVWYSGFGLLSGFGFRHSDLCRAPRFRLASRRLPTNAFRHEKNEPTAGKDEGLIYGCCRRKSSRFFPFHLRAAWRFSRFPD